MDSKSTAALLLAGLLVAGLATVYAGQAASAHTFCVGLLGAALRLGVIGHIHGQDTLTRLRPSLSALLAQPVPALEDMYTCAPAAEIAAMRHEVQSSRLFAN